MGLVIGYRGHEDRLFVRGPNWWQITFPPTRKIPRIAFIKTTTNKPTEAQIEAAARALHACEMARCRHANALMSKACGREIFEGNDEPFEEHAATTWRLDAEAALRAAFAAR